MRIIDVCFLALLCGAFFIWSYFDALPLLNYNKIDAAWFVVQTITSTGYGSLPWENNDALKILSIKLMLGGVTLWSLLMSAFIKYFWPDGPTQPPVIE